MYIVKYLALVHKAESHARASFPYELVLNILRYIENNTLCFHDMKNLS